MTTAKRLTDSHHDEPGDQHNGPPMVESVIGEVLREWIRRRKLPDCMPYAVGEAIPWWIDHQEPPDEWLDQPRRVPLTGGEGGSRWECPYHMRLANNLRAFLRLPAKDQRLIVNARESGIFWRGEPMIVFLRVIEQIEQMRATGKQAFREKALKVAAAMR